LESFVKVAEALRDAGRDVRVVIGEVEQEQRLDAIAHAFADVARVDFCPTLFSLCDKIMAARAFIGNDTGPTHLAAMLGRRAIGIYGPASDAVAWAPVGPDVHVLPFSASTDEVATLASFARN